MADAAFRQWQRRAVLFATVQTRKRAAAAAAAAEDDERQRRARKEAYIIAGLANAGFLVDDSDGKRRVVERTEGGWSNSTIQTYLLRGDAQTYHLNFRCTKKTFAQACVVLYTSSGLLSLLLLSRLNISIFQGCFI